MSSKVLVHNILNTSELTRYIFFSILPSRAPYQLVRIFDAVFKIFFSNMRKTMWVVSALVSISYLNSISCFMIKPSLPIKFIQSSIKSRSILKIFSFYNFTHSRIVIFDSSLTKDAFISLLISCCITIVTILLSYTLSFKHFSL